MMDNQTPKAGELRVWWIPQVPGNPFHVTVKTPEEGKTLLGTLALYDQFQLVERIKPDFCNAGGLEVFEDGEWSEWECPDTWVNIDEWEPNPEPPLVSEANPAILSTRWIQWHRKTCGSSLRSAMAAGRALMKSQVKAGGG